jgi:cytochrome d ubiquinol oxidase subunit I
MTFSGWVATVAGWYVSEIGRQPFLVQGVLRTAEAASAVPPPQIAQTLAIYLVVYVLLIVAYISVLRYMAEKPIEDPGSSPARRGERPVAAGAE